MTTTEQQQQQSVPEQQQQLLPPHLSIEIAKKETILFSSKLPTDNNNDTITTRTTTTTTTEASELVTIINDAYKIGEDGIFYDTNDIPFYRISSCNELESMINDTENITVLLLYETTTSLTPSPESNGTIAKATTTTTTTTSMDRTITTNQRKRLIGCIKIQKVINKSPTTTSSSDNIYNNETNNTIIRCYEVGCYAIRREYQGKGYGKILFQQAEQYIKNILHGTHIILFLLTPQYWQHTHKERLRIWYTSKELGYSIDPKLSTTLQIPIEQTLLANTQLLPNAILQVDSILTMYSKKIIIT